MTQQEFPKELFEQIQTEASDLAKTLEKLGQAQIRVHGWQSLLDKSPINQEIADAHKHIEELIEKLAKTKEGVQLDAQRWAVDDLDMVARHLEEGLRGKVKLYAEIMGDKPDVLGITVRPKPLFTYMIKDAVEYCTERMPSFLTVDKNRFDKVLEAMPEEETPFVQRTIAYTPVITKGKLEILPELQVEPSLPTEENIPF